MAKLLHGIICLILSLQLSECNIFIPQIPEECVNQTICEDVPNYPHDYVESIIKELDEQGYIWRSDGPSDSVQSTLQSPPADPSTEKFENHYKILDMCPSVVKKAIPLAAKDDKGKWHFVINRIKPPFLTIHVEKCEAGVENNTCGENLQNKGILIKPYGGYSIRCRQEFLHRIVSCLDEIGKVKEKVIAACACCSCAVFEDQNIE